MNKSSSRNYCVTSVVIVLFLFVTFFSGMKTDLVAQNSREAEITQEQEEKSKKLEPYKPNRIEKYLLENERLPLVSPPQGFYPYIGSAFPGGGLAAGPGLRLAIKDDGFFDVHGAWSIRNYKLVETSLKLPDYADGHLSTFVQARYQDANKVSFFGIGNDTDKDDRTTFSYRPIGINVQETFRPVRWLAAGGGVGYLDIETGPGEDSRDPSIEEVFSPIQAPGLGLDPTYLVTNVFLSLDSRRSPGYTTSGAVIRGQWFNYSERNDSRFDFRRFDAVAAGFIPVLRGNQVIALRALTSITDVDDPDQVPFFLLPKLGGGEELRGFRDFRFRDRHRMLLTAEYRWTPSKFMDVAIFYDTGKVASRRGDLDFDDLHDNYGIGIRFHSPTLTAFRIEVARSTEGTRLIFGAGPVF